MKRKLFLSRKGMLCSFKAESQKKYSYFFVTWLAIFLFFNLGSLAQTWQPRGPDDTDWPYLNGINYLSMDISGSGIPYVVYMDRSLDDKATSRKFQGGRWVNVGIPGFSEGAVAYTSITVSNSGIPYVVYQENNFRATVKKFISGNWVYVGEPGFTEGYALNTAIDIDDNGTPYVVYIDDYGAMAGAISVKKFEAGFWVTVGQRHFSAGRADAPSIVIDKNGTPYVIYQDLTNNHKTIVKKFAGGNWKDVGNLDYYDSPRARLAISNNGTPFIAYYDETAGKVQVKKFRSGNWINVGDPGFLPLGKGLVYLAINHNGTLYLTYMNKCVKKFNGVDWTDVGVQGEVGGGFIDTDDYGALYILTDLYPTGVKKFTAGQWMELGTRYGFSSGAAAYISTAVDGNSTPFTVYQDKGNSAKATVKKFYNGNWIDVGLPGISEDSVWYTSISIRNNGTPFVVYKDKANNGKATVKKYYNGSWKNVGLPGFSAGEVAYTSIVLNNEGIPYVIYRDDRNGGRVTVKKYYNGSWKNVGLPGFSAGEVTNTSIVMECGSIPWVVYREKSTGNVTVRKFKNGNWQDMGSPGISSLEGSSIAINEWGTPYVVYRESWDDAPLVVKYLTGINWVELGPPVDLTGGYQISNISIVLNAGSDPFVAYVRIGPVHPEAFATWKLRVKKFNGVDWADVWPDLAGGIQVSSPSMVITPADKLIVVYNHSFERGAFSKITESCSRNPEMGKGNTSYKETTAGDSSITNCLVGLNLYPNPILSSSRICIVLNKKGKLSLRLSDIQGKQVWTNEYNLPEGTSTLNLPVSQIGTGSYVLEAIINGSERKTIKIIK